MTDADSDRPTVLVVEDERHLADLYAEYLGEDYRVLRAYSGAEALDRLSPEVDVALVDRRMPMRSGSEVVADIAERNFECRVAMLTAGDPEFDIIDLGVDDYLVKPVTRDDLLETVDRLVAVTEYAEALRELTRKKLTRNVLRVEKSREEVRRSERYRELETEIGRLETTVEALANQLDVDDVELSL